MPLFPYATIILDRGCVQSSNLEISIPGRAVLTEKSWLDKGHGRTVGIWEILVNADTKAYGFVKTSVPEEILVRRDVSLVL